MSHQISELTLKALESNQLGGIIGNRHIYKWNGLGNPEAGLTMWKFNEWQLFCSIKWKKDG